MKRIDESGQGSVVQTRRALYREIALDTQRICKDGFFRIDDKEISLKESIRQSIEDQIYWEEGKEIPSSPDFINIDRSVDDELYISVTDETTVQAALRLDGEGFNTVVLNFADAHTPGGLWLKGASTQEEEIAKCSALVECLEALPQYYLNNIKTDQFYTDGIILTPNVPFFKNHYFISLDSPKAISVITCPAPNINGLMNDKIEDGGIIYKDLFKDTSRLDEKKIKEVLCRRIDRILQVAEKSRCQAVVLGAWGCGAFGNDVFEVAKIFKEKLKGRSLRKVVFAIPAGGTNYAAFKLEFGV